MGKKLLKLDDRGVVVEIENYFDPASYRPENYTEKTVVVDQDLPDQTFDVFTKTTSLFGLEITPGGQPLDGVNSFVSPQTSPVSENEPVSISINPFTEQIIRGTVFGQFSLNEQVFQSTVLPEIVNNYSVGGVTLDTFVPTIGTIGVSGEIGVRAAQFKGTYTDLAAQKAAGIRLPAFTTTNAATPYFLLEGWMYLEAEPSNNYDPILVTRSADGVNNSNIDSFRLEYDTSSDQVQFHYSDASYASAGYQGIVNVSPSGISTGVWNHFAVAWALQGGSASIKTYWNGISLYSASGLSGCIRTSSAPVIVGSGASGDHPFKGWMDDLHIRGGGVTLALADYALFGSSGSYLWEKNYAGNYTIYHLSMNGPPGTTFFPVDNLCRVSAAVSFRDFEQERGVFGASLIIREDTDVHGFTLYNGVCGGFTASGGSAGYVFGYDSGACIIVSGVTQTIGLTSARTVRQNAADYTTYFLLGITVMYGASGNSGDFRSLFSGWTGGNTYSFLPIQSNVEWLRNAYDNIVVAGFSGNTVIEDYYGNQYNFRTGDVARLYSDVLVYKSEANTLQYAVRSAISGATTHTSLNEKLGISTGAALKIAPQSSRAGSALLVSPNAKITKVTTVPESKSWYRKGGVTYGAIDEGELLPPP